MGAVKNAVHEYVDFLIGGTRSHEDFSREFEAACSEDGMACVSSYHEAKKLADQSDPELTAESLAAELNQIGGPKTEDYFIEIGEILLNRVNSVASAAAFREYVRQEICDRETDPMELAEKLWNAIDYCGHPEHLWALLKVAVAKAIQPAVN